MHSRHKNASFCSLERGRTDVAVKLLAQIIIIPLSMTDHALRWAHLGLLGEGDGGA